MSTEPYTTITLRDVYKLLIDVRDIVLAEQERRRSFSKQLAALWTLNVLIIGALVTAGIKTFA